MLLGPRRTIAAGAAALLTTIPFTAPPAAAGTPATTPAPAPVQVDDPSGWRAVFPAQPQRTEGSANGSIIHRVEVDNDIATIASYPETTFGLADTPPAQQAETYAQNFGGGRVTLANTPTTLAGAPAAVFVFDLNAQSGPARMFGLALRRGGRIHFITYFDRGRDSAEAGRRFVESFAVVLAARPAPLDPTTPTTPLTAAVAIGDTHWQLSFPIGAVPEWATGVRHGLGTQWWSAIANGDTLRVDASELPGGYEFVTAAAAELGAQIASPGATGSTGTAATVGNYQAVRFEATADDGSPLAGITVKLPTQLVTVSYTDVGSDNPAELTAFLAALATS